MTEHEVYNVLKNRFAGYTVKAELACRDTWLIWDSNDNEEYWVAGFSKSGLKVQQLQYYEEFHKVQPLGMFNTKSKKCFQLLARHTSPKMRLQLVQMYLTGDAWLRPLIQQFTT